MDGLERELKAPSMQAHENMDESRWANVKDKRFARHLHFEQLRLTTVLSDLPTFNRRYLGAQILQPNLAWFYIKRRQLSMVSGFAL